MRIMYSVCCAVLGGVLLMGCDDQPATPTPTTPPAPTADGAQGEVGSAREAFQKGIADGRQATKDAAEEAKNAAAKAADQAKDAASDAAENTSAIAKQAQEKLDQAIEYIKENKYDLADKALGELEQMKDQLSPAFQTQVANARQMLNAARNKPDLPALPGGNK